MYTFTLIPLLSLLPVTLSAPIFGLAPSTSDDSATGKPTALSLETVNSTLVRPALFSRVAYCESATITAWTCGKPCEALSDITFLQSGGGASLALPFCLLLSLFFRPRHNTLTSRRTDEGAIPLCESALVRPATVSD